MTKIAFVSCRIFEDELTYLTAKENENKKIMVIETDFIETFENKLAFEKINYIKIKPEDLEKKIKDCENEDVLIIQLIEFSMESKPNKIKDLVYEKIREIQPYADGILVFYGLCGNVLGHIEKDLSTLECPVRILKDENGEIADDCIGVSLGGRERYVSILKSGTRGEGTYFLTPMQAAHWREIAYSSAMTPDPNDDDMIRMIFEYSNYKNVGKVTTGLKYEEKFDDIIYDFSKRFNMEIIEYDGTLSVIENSYGKLVEEIEQNKKAK
jgi:hypothetical protein